ncbi:MAG TPA: hypothetical protein VKD24_07085 [Candidatus Angelobacter sp.]|nr:hypothetical protein [Candidatus Angelobacter sp.]
MAAKAAAVSSSLEDDVALTQEEQAALQAEETEQPVESEPQPQEEPSQQGLKPIEGGKKGQRPSEAVPFDRFEAVSTQLRNAEAQLAQANEYRERWARLEERQKQAQEASEMARQAEALARAQRERPDPTIDPVGARAYDAEQRAIRAEQGLGQVQQQLQWLNQQGQQNQVTNDMQNWLAFQVPQGRQRYQDYDTRVDYARAVRYGLWNSTFQTPDGREVQFFPPDVAREITAREEFLILQRCKDLGIPVADVVARFSDMWGYQGWLQQAQAQQAQNGNGAVQQAAPAQVLPSGNQRLQQIERGQAVRGLGRVQSGETNQANAWQTMSNAEFKAFVGNMSEDQYLTMIQDPRIGKMFEKRVGDIDLTDLNA